VMVIYSGPNDLLELISGEKIGENRSEVIAQEFELQSDFFFNFQPVVTSFAPSNPSKPPTQTYIWACLLGNPLMLR